MLVILDSGPLGLLSAATKKTGSPSDCQAWAAQLVVLTHTIVIPEISDYEVRRELIRAGFYDSVDRLDALQVDYKYLPITTEAMLKAAELWATARQAGKPTAGDKNIDGDVILAAQALMLNEPDYVIATMNVGHIGRYANAQEWQTIGIT